MKTLLCVVSNSSKPKTGRKGKWGREREREGREEGEGGGGEGGWEREPEDYLCSLTL